MNSPTSFPPLSPGDRQAVEVIRQNGKIQLAWLERRGEEVPGFYTVSGKPINWADAWQDSPPSPVIGWRYFEAEKAPEVPGCIGARTPSVYTEQELRGVFNAWGCTEETPKKGKCVFVNFAPSEVFCLARVSRREQKTEKGKPLFSVWLYRRA